MYTAMKRSDYNLLKSFSFAFSGIIYALGHERNLRIHFAAAALVLYLTRYYSLSRAEFALLLLVIGLVITCELLNTAIETNVDLKTPVWNSLAKIAKDVAAGAVLVSGLTALAVAAVLFWDIPTFYRIFTDIRKAPAQWILLAAISLYLIFLPGFPANGKSKRS